MKIFTSVKFYFIFIVILINYALVYSPSNVVCEALFDSEILEMLATKPPVLYSGNSDSIMAKMNIMLENKGYQMRNKSVTGTTTINAQPIHTAYYGKAVTSRISGGMIADNVAFTTNRNDSVIYEITITEYNEIQNAQRANLLIAALMAIGMKENDAKALLNSCEVSYGKSSTLPYDTAYTLFSKDINKTVRVQLSVDKYKNKKYIIDAMPSENTSNEGIPLR